MRLIQLFMLAAALCCKAGTILPGQTINFSSSNLLPTVNLLTSAGEFPVAPSAIVLTTSCVVGTTCRTTVDWSMQTLAPALTPGGVRSVLALLNTANFPSVEATVSQDGSFQFFGRYDLFGSLYALDGTYWEPFSARVEFVIGVVPTNPNQIQMTLTTLQAFETPEPAWTSAAVLGLLVCSRWLRHKQQ